MPAGGCRCGAIRYEVKGAMIHSALCHCADCRASSGAPVVAWTAFAADDFEVMSGEPVTFQGTGGSRRQFCGKCGTGLFFRNEEVLPGIVDIQTVTLDDPESFAPQAHIQTAERLGWMKDLDDLPAFERFPG